MSSGWAEKPLDELAVSRNGSALKPSGWNEERLGNLFTLQLGKMLNKKARTAFPRFPYLGNRDVQWGRFDVSALREMHFDKNERKKFRLLPGDLLVCEGGEIGRTALWMGEFDCYYQKAIHRLRVRNPGRVEPRFILHFMQFAATSGLFTNLTSRSSIAHLTREKLALLRVSLPPLPGQRKIASILSSVDDAIEKTQAVIDQVQVVKRGLLQELLTRGLPRQHRRFEQTKVGEVLKEWRLARLGDVGTWLSGGTPSTRNLDYWTGTIPWVSGKDMKRARLDDALEHVSIDAVGNGTRVTPVGSILIVVRGMILAHTFPVALTLTEVAFNQDLKALVPDKRYDPEFLLYWLQYREGRILSLIDTASHGTKRLATTRLFAELVPCPEREEQERIAQLLRSNDSYRSMAVENLERLAAVKQALMSVLLTGELRVTPDTESV